MKKGSQLIFFTLFIISSFNTTKITATFNFSHQASRVKLNPGTNLTLNNILLNWNGTLIKPENANIHGQNIGFASGILQSGTSEGLLTGTYDPTGQDIILLQGNGRFNAQPGTVLQSMQISGGNNSLEGQPLFRNSIVFDGSNTTSLFIAIQNKLNKNLELNGSNLILKDNLYLADNVLITGGGVITLSNNTLSLPAKATSWTDSFTFQSALDIILNAKTSLGSTWVFNNDTIINGNGNILDLSHGGRLKVKKNTTLYLTDIYIKGLITKSFDFQNNTSQINMSDVDIELAENVQTDVGNIYIEGATTFLLKDNDWTFDTHATLSVDGTTLWLDTDIHNPGQLKIPNPLFIDHAWRDANKQQGIALGNFSLINTGTVKETIDHTVSSTTISGAGGILELPCQNLTSAPLTSDVTLEYSCHINPPKFIQINEDLTINGSGAFLEFSDPEHSQFKVLAGKTVTLKNIKLKGLNEKTFDLRAKRTGRGETTQVKDGVKLGIVTEGEIKIGENVVFEMSEDITFSQGQITLINDSDDVANVFYLRGGDAKKRFNIIPDPRIYSNVANKPSFINIGQNTIALQNVEFNGYQHISKTTGPIFTGAIGLTGEAVINLGDPDLVIPEQDKERGARETINMVFVVQGLDNKFMLKKNDLYFDGQLLFADIGDNALHVDFVLTERIGNELVGGVPIVNFKSEFIDLTSFEGVARLIFDDISVRINNAQNAFLVFENSFLGAKKLIISGDPIWDFFDPASGGNPFVLEAEKIEVDGLESAIVSEFENLSFRTYKHLNRAKTALHTLYEKERSTKTKTKTTQQLRALDFAKDVKVNRFENIDRLNLGKAKGNILLVDTQARDFTIDPDQQLDLLLGGENSVQQKNQATTLKENDTINVVGENNKLVIKNILTINGNLVFDNNSELTFEFDEKYQNTEVFFANNNQISLATSSRLVFKGNGTVRFSDGSKIKLLGTTSTNKPSLSFSDSATLKITNNGTMTIHGQGRIQVDRGAQIDIGPTQHLIIGESQTDNIDIKADRLGIIKVDSSRDLNSTAQLSIQFTTHTIDFEQGGMLTVGRNGIFEINSLNNTEKKGKLTSFKFDTNGILNVDSGGTLRIGPNKKEGPPTKEVEFEWDNLGGKITGEGIVQLTATQFAGKIQSRTSDITTFKAEQLVSLLTNRVQELKVSTVFIDINGNKKIRMNNDQIFNLSNDDQIISDDAKTGNVNGINDGIPFILKPNGIRS